MKQRQSRHVFAMSMCTCMLRSIYIEGDTRSLGHSTFLCGLLGLLVHTAAAAVALALPLELGLYAFLPDLL